MLFCIQHPQNRAGEVFNCLAEAKKHNFSPKSGHFLPFFSMKNGEIWCIRGKIATAAVSAVVRQLNFAIWRHRKIICIHTPTPHTPARSGRVQAERAHKHTQAPTAQPGVAGRSRNPSPRTHTRTAHPSQEWRGTSGAATQVHTGPNNTATSGRAQPKPEPKHTPTPHSPTWSGGVQAGRAHKHTQAPTPQLGVAGRSRNPSPSTLTHTAHPGQEPRGTSGARTQTHTHPNTQARSGGARPKPGPTTTQTQTQAPHNSRKPGVHSPGTEAARTVQVTRPNGIRRPGVRLHPKACAAWDLRRSVRHPSASEPQYQEHACMLWERDMPGSSVNL